MEVLSWKMDTFWKIGVLIFVALTACMPLSAAPAEKPKIKAKQVEFRKAEDKVIFTGDVVITRGSDVLYADRAVKNEKTNVIEAWGNVRGYFILESSETARLKAETAMWDLAPDRVELSGRPEVVYMSTTTSEVSAVSDRITLENAKKEAFFAGNAVISYGKNTAESNIARYSYSDKKIVLLKDGDKIPFIKYAGEHRGDFRADTITVFMITRNMFLDKNVECFIYQ